jgi:hypothetical protein
MMLRPASSSGVDVAASDGFPSPTAIATGLTSGGASGGRWAGFEVRLEPTQGQIHVGAQGLRSKTRAFRA